MDRAKILNLPMVACIVVSLAILAACAQTSATTPTSGPSATSSNLPWPPTAQPSPVPTNTPLPVPAAISPCQAAARPAGVPTTTPLAPVTPSLPPPDGSETLTIVGQIGGPTRAVAVADHYAFVGVGPRLTVLDISSLDGICELGTTQPLDGAVRGIAVSNNVAYVAAGEAGLYIIDTSDPAQPVVTGRYDSPGYAEGVSVMGQVAYLADGPYGLRLINIADSAQPIEISGVYELNYAFDVTLASGYAYIAAAGAGLLVADISDVAHPAEAGNYDTPGYAYGVAASGPTVLVADGWEGVQLLDVSNPNEPAMLTSIGMPGWAMDVAVNSDKLFVADADGGLRELNISDRLEPVEVGRYQTGYNHAAQVAVTGETVFLADIRLGLHVLDMSTPAQPRPIGLYSPMGYAQSVAVAGQHAFVSAEHFGFRVIDRTDPSQPREVAAALQGNTLTSVALAGTSAYVTTGVGHGSGKPPALYAIDIADPLNPQPSPEAHFEGGARAVAVQGNIAYYATEWGLFLVDLSDPLKPRELSFLQTSQDPMHPGATATGLAVDQSIAYVAVSEAGLYTIDVSDPRRPVRLGIFDEPLTLPTGEKTPKGVNIYDVVVAAPLAYILDNDSVRVLDVSDPGQPKALGVFRLPAVPFSTLGSARWLAVDGDRLFIADGGVGLLELDVSDPAQPRLAAELRLPGLASWVVLDGKYIWVADGEGGLFIVERSGPSASTSQSTSSGQTPLVTTSAYTFRDMAKSWQGDLQTTEPHFSTYRLAPYASPGSTLVVTSASDSGPGTFRDALRRVVSGDTITFDQGVFPPGAPTSIQLESPLPGLSQGSITVDASNAGVILKGGKTPAGTSGLAIESSNNTIMGLQILDFPGDGIALSGHNNRIGGDHTRGTGPLGEGNLISGNGGHGIKFCCGQDVTENRILGNYVGTDVTGMRPLGNGEIGIGGEGMNNIIGGLAPGERNVVSANGARDIYLKESSGNRFVGNYLGLDAAGQHPLSSPGYPSLDLESSTSHTWVERNVIAWGILIIDTGSSYNEVVGNYIGTDASGTVALGMGAGVRVHTPFNRIGGTQPGEGNVIDGGVSITASDVVVIGNSFGIDASGTATFGTQHYDALINLNDADHNFVGGSTAAERNVMGGAYESWLSVGAGSDFNFIAGNYLGTDASGTQVFPNGAKIGIWLEIAEHNAIQGNLIAGSPNVGVGLAFDSDIPVANYNILRSNQITQNGNMGIAVGGGMGNIFIANTVTGNLNNAIDRGLDNNWDDGSAGNYWSDYKGTDSNDDGIGDTPYTVYPNGVDNFPRMQPVQSDTSPTRTVIGPWSSHAARLHAMKDVALLLARKRGLTGACSRSRSALLRGADAA